MIDDPLTVWGEYAGLPLASPVAGGLCKILGMPPALLAVSAEPAWLPWTSAVACASGSSPRSFI